MVAFGGGGLGAGTNAGSKGHLEAWSLSGKRPSTINICLTSSVREVNI